MSNDESLAISSCIGVTNNANVNPWSPSFLAMVGATNDSASTWHRAKI